jgi:predicted GH43/DUF377 family glycosyl hydrolase
MPNALQMRKVPGYVVEPRLDGPNAAWEGHHTTNPCCFRADADARVFLGYRAGGTGDYYRLGQHDVWGSHLGLAILDERGEKVTCRLPLPIMTIPDIPPLPRDEAECERYMAGTDRDRIVVIHDFRAWVDSGFLYMIYQDASIGWVNSCIARMPCADFLRRVARSLELASQPIGQIRDEWRRLWWDDGVWEPCGVDGTRHIYASKTVKNDIVFIRLADGTLRMHHRPVPDIAVVDTGLDTFSSATPDGITRFGTLQTCIRPGCFDNSHIGANGSPVRARIGEADVYIDIVHGVHNAALSDPAVIQKWKLVYLPYLRVLDYHTGECLYYSEQPVLEADETWREYVEQGKWVASLPHLDAVMFAGGQLEAVPGRNGLDDLFQCYTGIGDTAVARAEFRLRDLIPPGVIEDIQRRAARSGITTPDAEDAVFRFPGKLSGWSWVIRNAPPSRTAGIVRMLEKDGYTEQATQLVERRPGYFDADGVFFDGASVKLDSTLGWLVVFRGVRWLEEAGRRVTEVAHGVMILDPENPARVLFRSPEPFASAVREDGWTSGRASDRSTALLADAASLVPEKVRFEIRRLHELTPMPSDMTKWLRIKAGSGEEFGK